MRRQFINYSMYFLLEGYGRHLNVRKAAYLRISLAAAIAIGAGPAEGAQRKSKIVSALAARAITPAQYRVSVENVDCSNVAQKISAVVPVGSLLLQAARRGSSDDAVKSEFETTPQYLARLGANWSAALGGTTKIVFVKELQDYRVNYNADRGVISISRSLGTDHVRHPRGSLFTHGLVPVVEYTNSTTHYAATNAYGASVQVESIKEEEVDLRFARSEISLAIGEMELSMPDITVRASPDIARLLKANGRQIIVAELTPPFFDVTIDHARPRIDYPYERKTTRYDLNVKLKCSIIMAGNTEVFRVTSD